MDKIAEIKAQLKSEMLDQFSLAQKTIERFNEIRRMYIAMVPEGTDIPAEIHVSSSGVVSSRTQPVGLSNSQKQEYFSLKKFGDKMRFLDRIFPVAYKAKEREELIKEIEGPTLSAKTLTSFPQKIKNLVYNGELLAAKYAGSNKHVFYIRPEWKHSSRKVGIKPEHQPLPESFGLLAEEKRSPEKIVWVPAK